VSSGVLQVSLVRVPAGWGHAGLARAGPQAAAPGSGQHAKTNSLPLTIALPLICFVWHQPAIPDDAWR
jgi:hypothetical protein